MAGVNVLSWSHTGSSNPSWRVQSSAHPSQQHHTSSPPKKTHAFPLKGLISNKIYASNFKNNLCKTNWFYTWHFIFSLWATFCCWYLQDGGRTNPLDAFNSGIEHIYMPVEPSCLRLGLRGGKGLWSWGTGDLKVPFTPVYRCHL